MAKQTFTTGQVLTAAQMTSLQQTAMGGGSTTAKTASYTLVAADAGTVVQMNSASATIITVNTGLFAAGDTVQIQNIGVGVCTITAGTATVNTAGSLALSQYEGGQLYFTSASACIFFDVIQSSGGGKVLQVVSATNATSVAITSASYTDTGLSLSITPSLATSKVLVLTTQLAVATRTANDAGGPIRLVRDSTAIFTPANSAPLSLYNNVAYTGALLNITFLDSPATTSATTYKTQAACFNATSSSTMTFQMNNTTSSTMILLEIGA
jgi:hypothetical protein